MGHSNAYIYPLGLKQTPSSSLARPLFIRHLCVVPHNGHVQSPFDYCSRIVLSRQDVLPPTCNFQDVLPLDLGEGVLESIHRGLKWDRVQFIDLRQTSNSVFRV
jgi:hypothetical protein